jgi:teichuronic acid exporter
LDDRIAQKAKLGMSIGFYTGVATQLTQFVFGIILARLLTPSDYGIVGMVAIFFIIVDTLQDGGFGVALLQQKEVFTIDYNTVFWLNILLSLLLYCILYFSAPLIAQFYQDIRLISIIRIIGLSSVIKAIGSTQGAYLSKCQHYMMQSKVYYFALVAGSIIAVLFAWFGYGFWSLIIKSFATTIFLTIGWWMISPWKPVFKLSFNSLKKLFPFGSKMLVTSLFDNFFNNIYSMLIGKVYNAQSLGYYNRAKGFIDLPDMSIRGVILSVLFPALSYYQDDNKKLKDYYKRVLILLAFVLFPIYSILFFAASPMILVLITSKWLPAVALLQILCIKSLFYPFESINGSVLNVKGKSSYLLITTLLRRAVFILLIIITIRFGITGLIWGLVADSFVAAALNYYFATKIFNYGIVEQVNDIIKPLLILIIPCMAMFVSSRTISNPFLCLATICFVGGVSYLALSYIFMKKELIDVLHILKMDRLIKVLN